MTSSSSSSVATPFVLDGSIGEGGGQVLRASVALSALLRKPLTVISIRAGRSKPGLAAQHLAGLQLVAALTGGRLAGGSVGSTQVRSSRAGATAHRGQIDFAPGQTVGAQGRYQADPGTAGSVPLLLQARASGPHAASQGPAADRPARRALPLLPRGAARPDAQGGHRHEPLPPLGLRRRGARPSPASAGAPPTRRPADQVLAPTLRRFGVEVQLRADRKGYYPKGGGIARVQPRPMAGPLRAVQLTERGEVVRVRCIAFIAGSVPPHVGDRMVSSAEPLLRSKLGRRVDIVREVRRETRETAFGDGTGITLVAETSTGCLLGSSALGERGVRAEEVGEAAAKQLAEDLATGACVDQHLQDQLLVYMALAEGRSVIRTPPLTLHATTCIQVCELLTQAKFEVKEDPAAPGSFLVACDGIGYRAPPQ